MSARQQQIHRVRRIFYWMVGCILVTQVGLLWMLDNPWKLVRFQGAAIKLKRIKEEATTPLIVCMGSSRCQGNFDELLATQEMRKETGNSRVKVFNMAIGAGDHVITSYLLDLILQQRIRPDMVVLETTPEMLNRNNYWLSEHVPRVMSWTQQIKHFPEICRVNAAKHSLGLGFAPCYKLRLQLSRQLIGGIFGDLFNDIAVAPVAPTPLTSTPSPQSGSLDPQPASSPINETSDSNLHIVDRWLRDYSIGGIAQESFEKILERCRQEQIRVIVYSPPVTNSYRSRYTTATESKFHTYIETMSDRYGFEFVDMRGSMPDAQFKDSHHLKESAAGEFTPLFVRGVLAPSWIKGLSIAVR